MANVAVFGGAAGCGGGPGGEGGGGDGDAGSCTMDVAVKTIAPATSSKPNTKLSKDNMAPTATPTIRGVDHLAGSPSASLG